MPLGMRLGCLWDGFGFQEGVEGTPPHPEDRNRCKVKKDAERERRDREQGGLPPCLEVERGCDFSQQVQEC